ncbi:MAG: hypothetical protein K5931_03375 [Lachnospiraceae bacterium]|nr:hypothetical protein [Lachnospiraceae bacterium]
MKITSFNPLILTKEGESTVKFFEELGFERRHSITITRGGMDIETVRMKDSSGHYVDVSNVATMERDNTIIRMNVDDFDKAYDMLVSKGFKNANNNNDTVETKSNKSAMMVSPSGFAFDLCQHIKD